jgi:hypothetical protein
VSDKGSSAVLSAPSTQGVWKDERGNVQSKNGQNIAISAAIYVPRGSEEGKKYPGMVVAHPGGGVKEQTAGLYARKLAEEGFVTIAFASTNSNDGTGISSA